MEKVTALQLLMVTKSFFLVRALAYVVVILAMLIVGAIGLTLCYVLMSNGLGFIAMIVFALIFGGFWGLLRFAKKYFLYMIKAAHVAAITEFIKTGSVPVTTNGYKGVIAYGTEKIKDNFGAANIAFVADALIHRATKQIMTWLNKAQKLFSFIPSADKVMSFINLVLSTALNYVDEAVLSYIFYKDDEKNGFKKSCDALVYYAQSWKNMLIGALKVAGFIWLLRIISFIILFLIISAIANLMPNNEIATILALLFTFIILYGIEAIFVVPFATCIMVNDFYKAIDGQPLKADLHGTLCKVSSKFKDLFTKSEQPMPEEPKDIATSF